MKLVFVPDSFKGTLSSDQICEILSEKAQIVFPGCETVSIPVADGGEGSVDCFLKALGGEKIYVTAKNPFFEDISAFYGLTDGGKTAIIEMACCAGLPLIEDRKDTLNATTFGVGQLMLDAARRGAEKIILGLGGSATTDGGCGAAAAAGVKFYNSDGQTFIPVGGTLSVIARIDFSIDSALSGVEIVTMCDIDNLMYGKTGAAHVFGPQKGASANDIEILDLGLRHLSEIIARDKGADVHNIPGTGAAGAMGAGMIAFFDSPLQMGIETVLDTVSFEEIISDADIIITGEGLFDLQSLSGKVVIGVSKRAKKLGKPVIALVGGAVPGIECSYGLGISAIFTINRLPEDFSVSREKSAENLAFAAENIFRLIKNVL